ncbi:MAG: SPOR domain-containing protein [Gemmatimonadaceae bacterium]|nr:SPOR domain-containing protein [Gemmatimonadaceae bacterium]
MVALSARAVLCAVVLAASAGVVRAQEIAPGLPPLVFRAIERARLADANGEHDRARRTLDSLVAQLPSASDALSEALFWRATFAADGTDAERDYRRLIVEAPVSPRVEESLLRLAEYEIVRGDGERARGYLQRVWRDFTSASAQARTAYWLAVSWFDAAELGKGCSALAEARARVSASDARLSAAIANVWTKCAGVPSARAANGAGAVLGGADSLRPVADGVSPSPRGAGGVAAPAPPGTTEAAKAPSSPLPASSPATPTSASATPALTPAPAPAPATPTPSPAAAAPASPASSTAAPAPQVRYSVQLAATETRGEAESMMRRLMARGIEARVDGESAPYRVRVGRYATWGEANARLKALKASGLPGFVAELSGRAP